MLNHTDAIALFDIVASQKCNTLSQIFVIFIMTLTVRLPETIESQLTHFCEALGVSKSQVVQSALKDWFAKPAPTLSHPLLTFADAAVSSPPSPDWPGPYSKDRLRQQVLASGTPHRAGEPVATYNVDVSAAKPGKMTAKRVPKRNTRKAAQARQTDPS